MAELPAKARAAQQAYLAMRLSKQQHIDYLRALEEKYSRYGQPDASEERRRRTLLATHDARVGEFQGAVAMLRQEDPEAFAELVGWLSRQAVDQRD